jgi:hypothetical protein
VISLSGDGGFTMPMGDLITLTQEKLPVKVVVFNEPAEAQFAVLSSPEACIGGLTIPPLPHACRTRNLIYN